ncbi:UNVERIFIED_CONTAM: hypothetical protein Scaly_1897000 [Sesamum calycinum]|uniref:Uncharacterized protein n=1 Tax=Sesamum calycinum TaxID=2727403 RepID=A0AAW2NFL7_9LAMI
MERRIRKGCGDGSYKRLGSVNEVIIPFSAFWLRSSVVSVLISLISDTWIIDPHDIKLILLGESSSIKAACCWGSQVSPWRCTIALAWRTPPILVLYVYSFTKMHLHLHRTGANDILYLFITTILYNLKHAYDLKSAEMFLILIASHIDEQCVSSRRDVDISQRNHKLKYTYLDGVDGRSRRPMA